MDDLSDLVWSQPQKKKSPPQIPKKPTNLSSKTTAKSSSDDVFGNLVDFRGQSKPDMSKLSLAEQQQQQTNIKSSPFMSSMSSSNTLSPQPARYSPSPRSSGYNSDTQRVLEPTVQRSATTTPINRQTGDAFDSLLDPLGEFGRGSGSKSPASSLNVMRSQTSTPSNFSDIATSSDNQWNLDLFDQTYMKTPERSASASPAPPASLDPFDMDPFEPSSLSQTPQIPTTKQIIDDNDNPLGILAGPPVRIQTSPSPPTETPQPPSPPSVAFRDHLVQQVVEMGFTHEQAVNALDATENGTDVNLAIELLLQDREASTPQRAQKEPTRRHGAISNEEARQQLWGEEQPRPRSGGRTDRRSSPRVRDDESRARATPPENRQAATFQQQKEKIVTQASELGGFLYKNASLFVKSSREKVEKYMQDMQTEGEERPRSRGTPTGGPSRPKWMTEAHDYSAEKDSQAGKFEKYADESSDEDPEEERRKEEEFRLERERQRKKYVAEQKVSQMKQQQLLDTADTYVSPSRRRAATPSGRSSGRSTPQAASSPNIRSASPVIATPKRRPARPSIEANSTQIDSANAHKQRGNDLFKLGQYSEAEQAYSQAIMQLPGQHDHLIILYNNRAAALYKNGDYKRAIEDSGSAVRLIGPDHLDDTSTHTIQGVPLILRDQAVKALTRKAQALEHLEKYADAITEYTTLLKIDGGKNVNHINSGLARCRKSINSAQNAEKISVTKPSSTPTSNGHSPSGASSNPFSVNFDPIMATTASTTSKAAPTDVDKSEAVKQMRAKAAQQDAEDEERFKVTDNVDRQLQVWKHGKEKNLRALLASVDTVLWPEATWKGANMSELIEPKRCKIVYMKAIAKVHPDKLGSSVTVEQKMLASGIFGTLNEAWDNFKVQNGL